MYYVEAVRQYKRTLDKQKGLSDVASNLLQQIRWFQRLYQMFFLQAWTLLAKLLQRSRLDVTREP